MPPAEIASGRLASLSLLQLSVPMQKKAVRNSDKHNSMALSEPGRGDEGESIKWRVLSKASWRGFPR